MNRPARPSPHGFVRRLWRGDLAFPATVVASCLSIGTLWAALKFSLDRIDWVWHYRLAAAAAAALIALLVLAALIGCLSTLRAARRAHAEGTAVIWVHLSCSTVVLATMVTVGGFLFYVKPLMAELLTYAADENERVTERVRQLTVEVVNDRFGNLAFLGQIARGSEKHFDEPSYSCHACYTRLLCQLFKPGSRQTTAICRLPASAGARPCCNAKGIKLPRKTYSKQPVGLDGTWPAP